MTGFFDVLNANARTRKHMEKAKSSIATREFDGPDGDYSCHLKRFTSFEKNNVPTVVFEFRTTEDEGEYGDRKIVLFLRIDDSGIATAEEVQETLFQYIQLMGVNTDQSQDEIESGLQTVIDYETVITVRQKTSKPKVVDGKSISYKNYSIIGSDAPTESTEEVVEEEIEVPFEAETEELVEIPEEGQEESEVINPEDWIGYECIYKATKYIIKAANNDSRKCILINPKTNKIIDKIAFDTLEWPDT